MGPARGVERSRGRDPLTELGYEGIPGSSAFLYQAALQEEASPNRRLIFLNYHEVAKRNGREVHA